MASSAANQSISCSTMDKPDHLVLEEFATFLNDPETAVAIAAIKALTGVIKRSTASTMMELQDNLRSAAELLKESYHPTTSDIPLKAGVELFLRYVTRCFLEFDDFNQCKTQLINRGELFTKNSFKGRNRISDLGHEFIRDGMVVFTHGYSRIVSSLLCKAAETKNFSVVVTEGRPDGDGFQTAEILSKKGIPTTVVVDAAMGYVMEKVDVVIVGACGIMENGGIINKIGTFPFAMVAKAMNRPFYVAAESYKFARLYPLNQQDIPNKDADSTLEALYKDVTKVTDLLGSHDHLKIENPSYDYTSPQYITLLFTDLGVLTPSAISDELIKLYQ